MPLINRIDQMKREGLDENQIAQRLREEGVSPRQIDEAFDQSQVKSAVGTYEDIPEATMPLNDSSERGAFASEPASYPQFPQPQEQIADNAPFEDTFSQAPPEQSEEAASQEQYPEYQYQPESYLDTEMITSLVEQIVGEKTGDIQKTMSELSRFKIELQGKVDNIDERLKRIELTIDKLQASIIGQVGNYGRNISDLKKEMVMTQESFSKILNPLSEHIRELGKITSGISNQAAQEKPAKPGKKDGFHSYMR